MREKLNPMQGCRSQGSREGVMAPPSPEFGKSVNRAEWVDYDYHKSKKYDLAFPCTDRSSIKSEKWAEVVYVNTK